MAQELVSLTCMTCGGMLEKIDGETYRCESCGLKYERQVSIPESSYSAIEDANKKRRNADFDKAMELYEQIIREDGIESFDIYWGEMLADLGIIYSRRDGREEPIFYKASTRSVFDNRYYKKAMALCTLPEEYAQRARLLDGLREEIVSLTKRTEADVIVTARERADGAPAEEDAAAKRLVERLELMRIKVFYTGRDLRTVCDSQYEPYLFAALKSAALMIVIAKDGNALERDECVRNQYFRYSRFIASDRKKRAMCALCLDGCFAEDLPYEIHRHGVWFEGKDGEDRLCAFVAERFAAKKREAPAEAQRPAPEAHKKAPVKESPAAVGGAEPARRQQASAKVSSGISGNRNTGGIQTDPRALRQIAEAIRRYDGAQLDILRRCLYGLRGLTGEWNDDKLNQILQSVSRMCANFEAKTAEADGFARWLEEKANHLESPIK